MGTATELKSSLEWRTEGRDIEIVERHFLVEDELPWEEHANAEPVLPQIGDELPKRSAPRQVAGRGTDALFQVRDIQAGYAGPGHPETCLVRIIYRNGPDWATKSGIRQTIWEADVSTASRTKYVDLDGNVVLEGLSVPSPLQTIRARLEGAQFSRTFANVVGKTNEEWFRLWQPGSVMFMGAVAAPVTSSDPYYGGATIEMEWQARPGGWDEERPKRNINGQLIIGSDGLPEMTTHKVAEQTKFKALFPRTFDPGAITFWVPFFPPH
jgi:hypothetical protein